jgi:hypothetical protein
VTIRAVDVDEGIRLRDAGRVVVDVRDALGSRFEELRVGRHPSWVACGDGASQRAAASG